MQIEIIHLENAGVGKIGDVNDSVPKVSPFTLVRKPTENSYRFAIPIHLVLRLKTGKEVS